MKFVRLQTIHCSQKIVSLSISKKFYIDEEKNYKSCIYLFLQEVYVIDMYIRNISSAVYGIQYRLRQGLDIE